MTVILCPSCGTGVPAGFKFCGECGAKLPAGAPPQAAEPQAAADESSPHATAAGAARDEFRDVTVLFADVTGFTAMSERLDPEAVHRIMNECFDGLGRIVQTHGGHIDKYIGDSIMALFGAPTAHDDDPVRAAEAAIDMQKFLTRFALTHIRDAGVGFKMRIGLNSGLVLAGSIGTEGRRDYSVMGDAVNIASRLESAARPGSILVSAAFKRRVESLFIFGPAAELKLKGKEREIEAFELIGEAVTVTGQPKTAAGRPFVGRTRELAMIRQAIKGRAEAAKWIEVRGPLGIGKSRLVEIALGARSDIRLMRIVSRPTTRVRPFALARRMLYAIYQDFTASDRLPQTREDFASAFHTVSQNLEPYLNALWYLAAPDALGLKTPDPDPLTFRRTVDRGLAMLLANLARADKALVLFLDAYDLSDAETRSFFEAVFTAGPPASPPVIATVRGEEPPVHQATATITLERLDAGAARKLLELLPASAPLPPHLKSDILARADGVPLFLEELVHKISEDRAALDPAGGGEGTQRSGAPSALPSSLLGVMISRLDRLDATRRDVLSQCSVQGVEFSRSVTEAVWRARGGKADALRAVLADLETRQLVQRHDRSDERWSFAQVLMQNACYDSMLKRDRRALHRDVAAALVSSSGGLHAVGAEMLATHYELSEQWMEAARQNLRAGDRAAEVFANADALSRYSRALKAVRELGQDDAPERLVSFGAHRGASLVHLRVGNYLDLESHAGEMRRVAAHPAGRAEADRLEAQGRMHRGDMESAEALLVTARAHVPPTGNGDANGVTSHILYDLADLSHRRGRNTVALSLIGECRALIAKDCVDTLRLDILEGRVAHTEGRFQDAVRLYEHAYKEAKNAGSLSEEALTSNYMGNAARDVGRYGEAQTYFAHALDIWQRTGVTESIAGAHNNLANLAISRGDPEQAQHHYLAALDAFAQIGNAAGKALSLTNLAILAIETGVFEDAVSKADEAKIQLSKSGNRVLLGLAAVVKGEALIETGRITDAKGEFRWVLEAYDEKNHPLAIAGALRGMGRVAIHEGAARAAVRSLEAALALYERLAREQEAARTELHLARASHIAGDHANSRKRLENARRRFKTIGAVHDLDRAEKISF